MQANFPEQKRAQAGPLTCYEAIRSLPDGSTVGLLRKHATANPFTRASCYSLSSKGTRVLQFDKKTLERTTLPSPPAIDKEPRVKRKNVC